MNKIIMQNRNRIEAAILSNNELLNNVEYTLPNRTGLLPIITPEMQNENNIEITVGPTGDFRELYDAVQEMSKFTVLHSKPKTHPSPRKVIKILPNYIMEKQLWCLGGNYSDICIDATENPVNINREAIISNTFNKSTYFSFRPAIMIYNSISPLFRGSYTMMENGNMNITEVHLFCVIGGRLTIDNLSTLTGGYYGIYAAGASTVKAEHCNFIANNTTLQLIRVHGALVDCNRSILSSANVNGEELYKTGINNRRDFTLAHCSESAILRLHNSTLTGNNYTGQLYLAYSGLNGLVNLTSSTFNNNSNGVSVSYGGIISITGSKFNNITTETSQPVNTVSGYGLIFK